MASYKTMIVWQKSVELVVNVYKLTEEFPREEIYGLTSQIRRAAVSIPSNIAEGRRRGTEKDFRHFLINSFGSGAELETQIIIAKKLPKTSKIEYQKVDLLLEEVMKMLNSLISKIK